MPTPANSAKSGSQNLDLTTAIQDGYVRYRYEDASKIFSCLGREPTPDEAERLWNGFKVALNTTIDSKSLKQCEDDELKTLDPSSQFIQNGIKVYNLDFLHEACTRHIPLDSYFYADLQHRPVFSYPLLDRKTVFIDTTALLVLKALGPESRQLFVSQQCALFGIGEPLNAKQFQALVYELLYNPLGLSFACLGEDLGLNLRKHDRSGLTTERKVEDVWGGEGIKYGRAAAVNKLFEQYDINCSTQELSEDIKVVFSLLERFTGHKLSVPVDLDAKSAYPIELSSLGDRFRLIFNTSLFNNLKAKELETLVNYGLAHARLKFEYPHKFLHGDELLAYSRQARLMLDEDSQTLRELSSIIHALYKEWNTDAHQKFIDALAYLRETKVSHKPGINLNTLEQFQKEIRLHAILTKLFDYDRSDANEYRILNRILVEACKGFNLNLSAAKLYVDIYRDSLLAPTQQEILSMIQESGGDISIATMRSILTANPNILLLLRLKDPTITNCFVASIALFGPGKIMADLEKGDGSLVFQALSPGPTMKQHPLKDQFRAALVASYIQSNLIPRQELDDVIDTYTLEEKVDLYSAMTTGSNSTEINADSIHSFIDGIKKGLWSDAVDTLQYSSRTSDRTIIDGGIKCLEFILNGSNNLASAPDSLKETYNMLNELLVLRWGLIAGGCIRSEPQSPLLKAIDKHKEFLFKSWKLAADRAQDTDNHTLESLFLYAERYHWHSESLEKKAFEVIKYSAPLLPYVDLYADGESLAVARAAFRFIVTCCEPEKVGLIMPDTAAQAKVLEAAQLENYERCLTLLKEADLHLGGKLSRYILYQHILPLAKDSKQERLTELQRVLMQRSKEELEQIMLTLISNVREFKRLLAQPDILFKDFLIEHISQSELSKMVSQLATDEVNSVLSGISAENTAKATLGLGRFQKVQVIDREKYEEAIANYPKEVESPKTRRKIPSYYTLLGLPLRDFKVEMVDKSWSKLKLVCHPDLYSDQGQEAVNAAKERFQLLQQASEVLKNDELRIKYNTLLPNVRNKYLDKPWYEQ